MANNITANSHIQSLIDYVLDVKPYHVKVADGTEEYVFNEDTLSVSLAEDFDSMIVVGPDYNNSSNNVNRKVWANTSVRPASTTSTTRIIQSDGQRRFYSIPPVLFHKTGSQTGNVFETIVDSASTEIPGLYSGVYDQTCFSPSFGEIVSVKNNGNVLTKNVDYIVSRGAYSFFLDGTLRTYTQHNLPNPISRTGEYSFNDVIRKFGLVTDIVVDQNTNYEEWTLTYNTENTVNVVGSTSGYIGIATFGVRFNHSLISFTYKQNVGEEAVPSMQLGDEFLLTPSNKICIHPTAIDQIWTLINAGSFYKVFGSQTGWAEDAHINTWYDNGQIAFKVPKLEAWIYINGQPIDTVGLVDKSISASSQLLLLDGSFDLDGNEILDGEGILDAVPCVYTIKFHAGTPTAGTVHSASVFNNLTGYGQGLEKGQTWTDGWLTIDADGNWQAGDEVQIILAAQDIQSWFGNYDEVPYEWALYEMHTAERAVAKDALQEYFPLYHSKNAVIVLSASIGDLIQIEKAQRDYMRLRFGNGEDLHPALGADNGWIPLEYRPNVSFPNFVTSLSAYLATDPNTKVFTISQQNVGGNPGSTTLEFDATFFSDFITSSTVMTFQFHQSDNYGPNVGVKFSEDLHIQINTVSWNLFLDGTFDLDGSETLDGLR